MGKLTAGYVERLKPTDKNRRYSDGDGLSLMVRPNGSKAWQVRLVADGRKTDKGIGAYPAVRLAEARVKAKARREQVIAGRGEVEVVNTVPTFKVVAEKYIASSAPTWKNHKTVINTRSCLKNYAYPVFGDIPVNDIRRAEVLAVLEGIWTSKPAAAKKLRQRVRSVFDYALDREYIEVNPAAHFTRASLPPTGNGTHFRSLPYQEAGASLRTVEASSASLSARLCLRFVVLTAARSGEARGAT